MKVEINKLAKGIIVMSMIGVDTLNQEDRNELPRFVLTDFDLKSMNINTGQSFYILDGNLKLDTESDEAVAELSKRLMPYIGNKDVEIVTVDKITRAVIVITQNYMDKLYNDSSEIINMVRNYHQLWYNTKAGSEPRGVEKHNAKFKTFSRSEVDLVKSQYIPIVAVTRELAPIYDTITGILDSSALKPHFEMMPAYDVRGYEVQGGRTYWVPRIIAREYLEEISGYEVTSSKTFNRIIQHSGVLDGNPRDMTGFLNSLMDSETSEIQKQKFLLDRARESQEQFSRNSSTSKKIESMKTISSDFRATDSILDANSKKEVLTLGY